MTARIAWALAVCLLVLLSERVALAEAWAIEPRPSWVVPVEPVAPGEPPFAEDPNGRRYLLFDQQIRAGSSIETYYLWSRQITNEAGLAMTSQISIDFDPSYQTVAIHSVTVRRGTDRFERLSRDAVRIVQREPNLEAQVFDGRQSAVLFVQDLRIGDVVEYAFTIRGSDPTSRGHYADGIILGAPEPIGRLHARLVLPDGRRARLLVHAPDGNRAPFAVDPIVRGAVTEYHWDLRDVKAYKSEPSTPSWHSPIPWVQISDFESWADVARWGERLFRTARPERGALIDWVKSARDETGSLDAFMLRAIRFVQDEVRYVGIETGLGRRQPTDPATVFDRRYGDCKDKAALLVAMLTLRGAHAIPVLVSTTSGHVLSEWTPTNDAFDHVIVRAEGSDGAPYWIDATSTLQGGGLERFRYSGFEEVLPLEQGTTDLVRVPLPPALRPSLSIVDHFKLPLPGSNAEATLDSERTYEEGTADSMRVTLRGRTNEDLTKDFVALYQSDFPAIRQSAPVEMSDDRARNVIRVALHMAIPKVWTFDDKQNLHAANFAARALEGFLERPQTTARLAPFAIGFPVRAATEIRIDLPFDMTFQPSDTMVQGDAFSLHLVSRFAKQTLTYSYEVVTHRPAVPPDGLSAHLERIDEARALLTRGVTYRDAPVDGFNWAIFIALLGCIPFVCWGSWRAYRFEPRSVRAKTMIVIAGDPRLVGLGGWLVLLGLALVVNPLVNLVSFVQNCRVALSLATWRTLTTPGTETYAPALAVCVVAEAILIATAVVYGIAVAVLFFKKRRSFPFHFTVYAVGLALVALSDLVALSIISPKVDHTTSFQMAARATIWALIWVTYVHRSRRVAWTFIESPPRRRRRRRVSRD